MKRDHLENPGVGGRAILKYIFRKLDGGIGWIELAQHRDRWPAVENAVMNIQVP
jgi:hypothetical protein